MSNDDQLSNLSETTTSEEGPWYRDGLNFTCSQCGDCCTGAPGVVWVTDEELQRIAEHLDKPIGEIRLFHTRIVRGRVSLTEYENGDCTFFDPKTRHCRVYQSRPVQCRTWPFWDSHLESPQAWQRVCEVCPGSGTGQFFSLEEIQERARKLPM
jgi:Fe-S-cluster containining protein